MYLLQALTIKTIMDKNIIGFNAGKVWQAMNGTGERRFPSPNLPES